MKNKKYIFVIVIFLLISFFVLSIINKISNQTYQTTYINNHELDGPIAQIVDDYQNDDIIGTLEIPNTGYKTVVVQGKDNKYYLRRDVNKKYARGGTPFLDYRVNLDSKKLLIYGHNSKYVDMPFKILENYYNKSYYDKHKYLNLKTKDGTIKYEIFSVYVEPQNWSYLKVDFKNDNEYEKHLKMLKNNSMYDTGVEVSKDDQILLLQTCSTKKEYELYKKKFLLVIARKVSE